MNKPSLARRRSVLGVMLVLATTPYFVGLQASSLWDANEAFYAETPRRMLETGDYLNPNFNYQPRFNKPPLCYWIVAGFYHVFGVSEKAERIPIALGALILIATAFILGRLTFSNKAGLLAAITLATTPYFLILSRRIIIDVFVAMFMSLTLLFFMLSVGAESQSQWRQRKLFLVLMYASVGLGVLTKGPVALVLPALVFALHLAWRRNRPKLRQMMLPAGLAIVSAIVLPWYVALYYHHGWRYIKSFLLDDNISRYTEPGWGPGRDFSFYLQVILSDLFPWSLFLVLALFLAALGKLVNKQPPGHLPATSGNDDPNRSHSPSDLSEQAITLRKENCRLLLLWIVLIVAFYSFSVNKQNYYILPVYPAAAAIVGGLLARFDEDQPWTLRPLLRWMTAFFGLLMVIAGVAILSVSYTRVQSFSLAGSVALGCSMSVGGVLGLASSIREKRFEAISAIALAFVAASWIIVLWTLPDFERYKPVRALCEIIKTRSGPDALVGYYNFTSPSIVFYLRRPVFAHYDPEKLVSTMASNPEVYCIMTDDDYEALKARLPVPTYILASRPMLKINFKRILGGEPSPQVLLISNRDGPP